jgi:hypothetical protein
MVNHIMCVDLFVKVNADPNRAAHFRTHHQLTYPPTAYALVRNRWECWFFYANFFHRFHLCLIFFSLCIPEFYLASLISVTFFICTLQRRSAIGHMKWVARVKTFLYCFILGKPRPALWPLEGQNYWEIINPPSRPFCHFPRLWDVQLRNLVSLSGHFPFRPIATSSYRKRAAVDCRPCVCVHSN